MFAFLSSIVFFSTVSSLVGLDLCNFCTCGDADSAVCPSNLPFSTIRSGGPAHSKFLLFMRLTGSCPATPDFKKMVQNARYYFPNIQEVKTECCPTTTNTTYKLTCTGDNPHTTQTGEITTTGQYNITTTTAQYNLTSTAAPIQTSAFWTGFLKFFLGSLVFVLVGVLFDMVKRFCVCRPCTETVHPIPDSPASPPVPSCVIEMEDNLGLCNV